MIAEQSTRKIDQIMRRLDLLEATAHISYDKGNYTPTYLGGTTAGVTTYAANGQVGRWVRAGVLIFFYGRIQWTAATGTGDAQISLPFQAVNVTNQNYSVMLDTNTVTFAAGTPQGLIQAAGSFFIMRSPASNLGSTTVQVEAAGIVNFSGFFEVAP